MGDFSTEPHVVKTEPIDIKKSSSSAKKEKDSDFLFALFYIGGGSRNQVSSNKEAFEASKKKVNDSYSDSHI